MSSFLKNLQKKVPKIDLTSLSSEEKQELKKNLALIDSSKEINANIQKTVEEGMNNYFKNKFKFKDC